MVQWPWEARQPISTPPEIQTHSYHAIIVFQGVQFSSLGLICTPTGIMLTTDSQRKKKQASSVV